MGEGTGGSLCLYPCQFSPYYLVLSLKEPVPKQLVLALRGRTIGLVSWGGQLRSEARAVHIACTRAAQLRGGDVEVHQVPPNLRANVCTPPEAKGAIKIQA